MSICNQNELKSLTINRASARAMSPRNSRTRAGNPTRVYISENVVNGAGWATTRPKRFSGSLHASTMKRPRVAAAFLFITAFFQSVALVSAALSIGGVSSTDACYEALQESKGDDDRLDKDEYVQFVNTLSDNFFTAFQSVDGEWGFFPVTDFYTFPKDIQDNFWKLACGGSGGSLNICDNAYLYAEGSGEGEVPTDFQTVYLFQVCKGTENAIDDAKPQPTTGPTPAPSSFPVTGTTPWPTYIPTFGTTSAESTVPTASSAPTYSGQVTAQLKYQITVDSNITSESLQDAASSLRTDLQVATWVWMTGFLDREFNMLETGNRGLRGGLKNYSGNFEIYENQEREIGSKFGLRGNTHATMQNGGGSRSLEVTISNTDFSTEMADAECNVPPDAQGDHCINISHNVTLSAIGESNPDEILYKVTSGFNEAIADGSFYDLIPPLSRTAIRNTAPPGVEKSLGTLEGEGDGDGSINPPIEENEVEGDDDVSKSETEDVAAPSSTNPVTPPTPISADSILGKSESPSGGGGGSNVAGIAAGVSIACVVAILGFFVYKRRRSSGLLSMEKDENKNYRELGHDKLDGGNEANPFMDEESSSSSSDSSSDSDSDSSSGSSSESSSSGSSSSGSGSSSSSESFGTEPALASIDNSSAAVQGSRATNQSDATQPATSSASLASDPRSDGMANSVEIEPPPDDSDDEYDAHSYEISQMIDDPQDDSDSDSDYDSDVYNQRNQNDSETGLDNISKDVNLLRSSDGDHAKSGESLLKTSVDSHDNHTDLKRSTESSEAYNDEDESSAGSSGWESSDGESTNTGSVESFDPQNADWGSTTYSKSTNEYSEEDDLIDQQLLPAEINPARNPVIQPGVMMIPVDEGDEEDEEDFNMSDHSSGFTSLDQQTAPTGDDIQSAIEKGDWAAVGATAAMLASGHHQNESTTASTYNRHSTDDSMTMDTSYESGDAARAAEIDQMVENGNWDGVVAVAAKYADDASTVASNGQESSADKETGSGSQYRSYASKNDSASIASASVETADASSYSGNDTQSRSRTTYSSGTSGSSAYSGTATIDEEDGEYTDGESMTYDSQISPSVTSSFTNSMTSSYVSRGGITSSLVSSASANTDEEQRMSAYRAEVEALVRRVVPDEIDNIDGIMVQFSGREEELIETLRAMQEKSIAQRAMAAVQRSAKKEAKTTLRPADDESSDPSTVKDALSFASNNDKSDTQRKEYADNDDDSYNSSSSDSRSVSSFYSGSSSGSESSRSSRSSGSSRSSYSDDDETGAGYSQSEYSEEVMMKDKSNIKTAVGSNDWQAVGTTAAKMRGGDSYNSGYSGSSREDQAYMEKMIDKGNWSGIIEKTNEMNS